MSQTFGDRETARIALRKLHESKVQYFRLLKMALNESTPSIRLKKEATKMIEISEQVNREMLIPFYEKEVQRGRYPSSAVGVIKKFGPKPTALTLRANACYRLYEYENAKKDVDEALTFYEDPSCEMDETILSSYGKALSIKGYACKELGELKDAFEILFKACTVLPKITIEGKDEAKEVMVRLYHVMGMLNKNKPRPQYTKTERDNICCKLQIHKHSWKTKKCYQCSSRASSLKLCGRCKVAWYCGVSCQRANWREHKSACPQLKYTDSIRKAIQLNDYEKDVIFREIKSDGYSILSNADSNDDEIALLLRDKNTGFLYESLTNQDAYFDSDLQTLMGRQFRV